MGVQWLTGNGNMPLPVILKHVGGGSRCIAALILHSCARSAERRGHFNLGTHSTRGRMTLRANGELLKRTEVFCTFWKSKIFVGGINVQLTAKTCV